MLIRKKSQVLDWKTQTLINFFNLVLKRGKVIVIGKESFTLLKGLLFLDYHIIEKWNIFDNIIFVKEK